MNATLMKKDLGVESRPLEVAHYSVEVLEKRPTTAKAWYNVPHALHMTNVLQTKEEGRAAVAGTDLSLWFMQWTCPDAAFKGYITLPHGRVPGPNRINGGRAFTAWTGKLVSDV